MKTIRFLVVLGAAAGLLFYEPTKEASSILKISGLSAWTGTII